MRRVIASIASIASLTMMVIMIMTVVILCGVNRRSNYDYAVPDLPMDYGFIIVRHVNNEKTNEYWQESWRCIRKFYPRHRIVMIDDNSNPKFVTQLKHDPHTILIQSEYPGRGELLPYLYYAKYGGDWFKKAVILHDSVFIQHPVDFRCKNYRMFWTFEKFYDKPEIEKKLIQSLDNYQPILDVYQKKRDKWLGCFGVMMSVDLEYLQRINEIHNLARMADVVKTRSDRCGLERVMACLMQYYERKSISELSLFGDIFSYCKWELTWDQYKKRDTNGLFKDLPLCKVWSGR
jgi:hypothetical protein